MGYLYMKRKLKLLYTIVRELWLNMKIHGISEFAIVHTNKDRNKICIITSNIFMKTPLIKSIRAWSLSHENAKIMSQSDSFEKIDGRNIDA